MKITNLRPKDGFYFKLEAGEIDLYAEDRTNPIRACQLNVDFDIVQPEYKVGDVVEVKTTTDTGYTKAWNRI